MLDLRFERFCTVHTGQRKTLLSLIDPRRAIRRVRLPGRVGKMRRDEKTTEKTSQTRNLPAKSDKHNDKNGFRRTSRPRTKRTNPKMTISFRRRTVRFQRRMRKVARFEEAAKMSKKAKSKSPNKMGNKAWRTFQTWKTVL